MVVAGDIDVRAITEFFLNAGEGFPFNGFVVGLCADRAAVDGGQHADGRARGDQGDAALQGRQKSGTGGQGE